MSSSAYQPAPFYLLRVPALPSVLFATLSQHGHIDLSSEQDPEQAWKDARQKGLRWLEQLATSPLIEQALLVASPSLSAALRKQKGTQDRRSERAYEHLLRYVIRMSSRPTPFGYCAGVAFGTFATQSHVQLERFEGAGVRPDIYWLWTVVRLMETRFLSFLEVQLTPGLLSFGKRGIGLTRGRDGAPDGHAWFTMTPVFHALSHYARAPILYGVLKQALLTDFPGATGEQVDILLHELYHSGVLVTTLLPSDEHDPLNHLLDVLRPIAGASEVVLQVEAIQKAMQTIPQSHQTLSHLLQQQRELTPAFEGTTVQIDSRIHLSQKTLSQEIGHEAARVAETLLRLGMYPQGLPSLHAARRTFLERYEEQEVPLLTLFSPQGGLDTLYAQESDLRDLPQAQQERLAQRARLLRTLAMQTLNAGKRSLALTPDLLERLTLWPPSQTLPPPLLDLYMQVAAVSTDAIDRGDWQGLVTLLPPGGRAYRRFLYLFGEQEQLMVADLLHAEARLSPDTLGATLAVLPPHVRDLNVMHGPIGSAYVIPLHRPSPYPPEQTILPDDLLVSVRQNRFCLRSHAHNKVVRVTQHHMGSFLRLPPLARFLLEASHDGEPFPSPFQWGRAGALPFLPRLTLGKMIISLAQWTLSPAFLERGGRETRPFQWFRSLQCWREQWRVPRYVVLVNGEDRLLLDLEHPLMVDMLWQEQTTMKKPLTFQEAFFHENQGWLRDGEGKPYASEIVIPLIRTSVSPKPSQPFAPYQAIVQKDRQFLPGQEWLSLKLYLPEDLQQVVLAGPFLRFVQQYRHWFDDWFFLRYHDPQAHLRVRFHQSDEQQRASLLQALLTWSHELQQEGLLMQSMLVPYERETERYGGPQVIPLLEEVFCANSEVVCALLARPAGIAPRLFEAVYALDRLWADWGSALSTRAQALHRFLPPEKEAPSLRTQRQTLLAFLERPPHPLASLLDRQYPVLAQTGTIVRQLAAQGQLWRTEEEILWSLSHLFCNRLLGTRRELEHEVYAAWHATVKTRLHRTASEGKTRQE